MGERQNHEGKALMGHGMSGMFGSASTGAPAAAPAEGTDHQELPEQRSYRSQHPASVVNSPSI